MPRVPERHAMRRDEWRTARRTQFRMYAKIIDASLSICHASGFRYMFFAAALTYATRSCLPRTLMMLRRYGVIDMPWQRHIAVTVMTLQGALLLVAPPLRARFTR